MDTQDMEKEKQQLTTQTSQKGLESRLENTWSLIPGLGAVWTACVRYLSNSLIQLLLASLLLMRAIWSNCASNCCFTCRGKRQIYVVSKRRLILCPQHLSFLPAVSFHSSPLAHLNMLENILEVQTQRKLDLLECGFDTQPKGFFSTLRLMDYSLICYCGATRRLNAHI